MDETQRRYMHARQRVESTLLHPVQELMDATQALCNAAGKRAQTATDMLEAMRPHWAQGYTSDSVAAQSKTTALSQLWELLGVDNQTAAMERLRQLIDAVGGV